MPIVMLLVAVLLVWGAASRYGVDSRDGGDWKASPSSGHRRGNGVPGQ